MGLKPPEFETPACLGMGHLFFAFYHETKESRLERERRALKICDKCPHQVECLEYSLAAEELEGVWGNMGEDARRKLIKAKRKEDRAAAPVRHARSAEELRQRQEQQDAWWNDTGKLVLQLWNYGGTLEQVADELHKQGRVTLRGKVWTAAAVDYTRKSAARRFPDIGDARPVQPRA